jgi:cell division septation protein DedD
VPKNEDGEFELILGNRQLLSVFFIVVILLGVFFTMGYIVGRNSGPIGAPEVAVASKPEAKPAVVDAPSREPDPPPKAQSASPVETAPQQPATAKQKPPEPVRNEPPKATPPKSEKVPPKQPAAGQTYLQLAATAKPEADVMVDVLNKKGFKARDVEIPEKPGTFRVLVGPLEDGSLNKTRSELQSSGFPGDNAIRKTF